MAEPGTAADRILAKLEAVQSQLDRLETRIERLEGLGSKVAVLERQDEIDRHNDGKLETRIAVVESEARGKVQALEARVQALEADRAERSGMTRAGALGWGALTAAPGLVGLAIALYQAIAFHWRAIAFH